MKIVVIGSDGQLGTDLCRVIPKEELIPLTINEIDITKKAESERLLEKLKPDVIINTAAYHDVKKCESETINAISVNSYGPENLARISKKIGSLLVHISTDYVFGGESKSPYKEYNLPRPINTYGVTKYIGELLIKRTIDNYLIIRTSGLFGLVGSLGKNRSNFVDVILRKAVNGEKLSVVDDKIFSPTFTLDLANKIYQVINMEEKGVLHITNSGYCSWWEFAKKIVEIKGIKTEILKTSSDDSIVQTPRYSVLGNTRTEPLRRWEEALEEYIKIKGEEKC